MQCRVISIGNELLIGDTVNTNASWLADLLTEAGIDVTHIYTIGDDLDTMKEILSEALSSTDLIITTGGLGPTHDDITKRAVTEIFDCELVLEDSVLEFIKKVFKKRNIPFSKSNYHQAEVPDCCEVLFNTQGTAPGMWFDRGSVKLAVLPGVPHEMKHLMNEKVMAKVKAINGDTEFRRSYYITTAGIGESTLSDEVIGRLDNILPEGVSVAYLPSPQGTKIRISAYGSSNKEIDERIDLVRNHIKRKAETYIIGEGKDLNLAKAVGELLAERDLSLSVAESCTGGYLANAITDIPGSSRYMMGGLIAYANKVKENQLGVLPDDLNGHGAVSKPVALQMAKGVANNFGADIGVSTTGIAGPGGGTEEKPVGTVWIGFWSRDEHFALKARFTNDRLINKERSAAVALEIVRRSILGIAEMPYGLKKYPA
ncbi:competence/damage-inducible protein A [Aliifodinibius salipaludis]|uniref:CinA-like protein n=1 Tax=Fodinibius salipaludis TaxID=2032627 RepID=A0A2A2GEG8_9BACT|nr:competence/damage-inducible protein A [Aliifodinibius salipaludis]PAU95610.1 competence/damage-inducible protein A [Aliifodinibius salipaludis]